MHAVVAGLALIPALISPAYAGDEEEAEKARLFEEMRNKASRGTWSAVEMSYLKILELGDPIEAEVHLLGAQAARNQGDLESAVTRLEASLAVGELPDARADYDAIQAAYGRVDLSSKGAPPPLEPVNMPFAPDQRRIVEQAQADFAEDGRFQGLLPIGEYTAGERRFTVHAGTGGELRVSVESDGKRPRGESAGFRVGPVVHLGVGYGISGEPPVEAVENPAVVQASGVQSPGLALVAGVELGAGMVGGVLAGTLQQALGSDRFSHYGGWVALSLRPGPLRIAAGPAFSAVIGRGDGVASWWADPQLQPAPGLTREDLSWQSSSVAFGGRFEVGAALLELGPLMGGASLGAIYQSDGVRDYITGGLTFTLTGG